MTLSKKMENLLVRYRTDTGQIDILAQAKIKELLVIELKKGRARCSGRSNIEIYGLYLIRHCRN